MNFLFASIFKQDPDEFVVQLGRMSPQARERLIILGAIGVVVLTVVIWAALFRKKPRHRRGHIRHTRHSFRKSFVDGLAELKRMLAQRERQRKRIAHRPRNPTRAEVGGLPQVRTETDSAAGDASGPRPNF